MVGLDDQVQVIPLHAELDQPKPLLLLAAAKGALEHAIGSRCAQAWQTAADPEHDVGRAVHVRPSAMRDPGAGTIGFFLHEDSRAVRTAVIDNDQGPRSRRSARASAEQ